MKTMEKTHIRIGVKIKAPIDKVWDYWNDPKHIVKWATGSFDWHTTKAENDLTEGGRFLSHMEAKDGSEGFDFVGKYTKIEKNRLIEYTIDDGREVQTKFESDGKNTTITQTFEPEELNSVELQREGWQTILDNFKHYAETADKMEMLHFEIIINASAEKVYQTMIGEKTYSEWTAEFNPTSTFKGSWEKGSKILFLGEEPGAAAGGMVSRIRENIRNRYISIEHVGFVKDGKEITSGHELEKWSGMHENYMFTDRGGKTLVSVDMDSNDEFKSYLLRTWPKALIKLKSICEK
jgi:uncharacterized protein YndB with AHSA1/START domain